MYIYLHRVYRADRGSQENARSLTLSKTSTISVAPIGTPCHVCGPESQLGSSVFFATAVFWTDPCSFNTAKGSALPPRSIFLSARPPSTCRGRVPLVGHLFTPCQMRHLFTPGLHATQYSCHCTSGVSRRFEGVGTNGKRLLTYLHAHIHLAGGGFVRWSARARRRP
jgi:hypothetical protein